MKKQISIFLLRVAIVVIGLIAVALCIFAVPAMSKSVGIEFPSLTYLHYPLIIAAYLGTLVVLSMLYQGFRILDFIDRGSAFSGASVQALKHIKHGATVVGILCALAVVFWFFPIAQIDDAPGVILIGMVFTAVPFTFAIFIGLMQSLLGNAIDLKSENDLTV